MKNLKIHHILKFVGIGLAVIALIFLALPGVSNSETAVGVTETSYITLAGFVFGGVTEVEKVGSLPATSIKYEGGMSWFVLLAVLLLLVGIVIAILSIVQKNKMLAYVGAILLVVAGISIFLLKVAGTGVTSTDLNFVTRDFSDIVRGMNLGAGTILFGVFGILSGACIGVGNFLETSK